MEAIDRIETVLEQREQTPYALCKFLGINQSSYSTWKARNTLPPAKYIADIARFLHVSTDYILTGKKSAYTDAQAETYTDDEKELLSIYKALPAEKRYEFKGEMKGYLKALEESKKYLDGEKRLSVYIGIVVSDDTGQEGLWIQRNTFSWPGPKNN